MSVDFKISGTGSIERAFGKIASKTVTSAGRALREEAEIEMTEAKQRTPVDTGALRGSGRVEGPETNADEVSVTLGFGGPAAPYALHVHENLEAFHKVGQAKYLESVLIESQPYMADRVAKRLKALLGL